MKITKQRLREIIREEIKNLAEGKRHELEIHVVDKIKVDKILKGLKLKPCKDYDIGVGKTGTFILDLDRKFEDKVLELLIKNRIKVKEL